MSGSPMSLWATSDSSVKGSLEIAEYLNCSTLDSKKLKICMKTKSIYDIMDAVNATGSAPYSADIVKFSPRADGDFFPRKLDDLIKESPKKPTLMGLAQKESAFFVIQGNCETLVAHIISPAKFDHFAASDIIKVIDEVFAPEEFFGDETKDAREDLYEHFVWRKHPNPNDTKFYLEMYTEHRVVRAEVLSTRREEKRGRK
ncbi:hypothetical protein AB6A40_011605 [Gnathostoma spinigerum]|uniref:Carboxylesterase type B domain-containing protein n=1 Tax=Gnathostoma spinigerum TaxID=75299 RepID=A0ABD6F388_9BILA